MVPTVYSHTLQRAAELLGGTEALREYLDVSEHRLRWWMEGAIRPPEHIFLKAVDLLAEREMKNLRRPVINA